LAKDTSFFYSNIAAPFIDERKDELCYTWFNIADYEQVIRRQNKNDDTKLISLYKLLSPPHLLNILIGVFLRHYMIPTFYSTQWHWRV
jgi:hypothetical protein